MMQPTMGNLYFDRQGNPMDFSDWVKAFEDKEGRRVGRSKVGHGPGKKIVSTVWLGLNHSFGEGGPPLIFETMIFQHGSKREIGHMYRYFTEEEAVRGHAAFCKQYFYNRYQRRRFTESYLRAIEGRRVRKQEDGE